MSITRRLALATFIAAVPLAANAGTLTTLHTFKGSDGEGPIGPIAYEGGFIYGATVYGGTPNEGTVFKVNADSGKFLSLHSFQGGPADGETPFAGVIDEQGILYGTTADGGGSNAGTIFSIDAASGAETILYNFSEFVQPGSLTYVGGSLYGTLGSAGGPGSIFSFDLSTDSFNTVYSFVGGSGGAYPEPQLLSQNGLLYGSTYSGGLGNCHQDFGGCGVIFSVDPATGSETVIHSFQPFKNGRISYSNLVYYDGNLIGDTLEGGGGGCKHGCGVSFAIKVSTGHEKVLNGTAGYTGLIRVGDSVYEGLTGAGGYGELVQVDLKSGQQTVLYTFTGGKDGANPVAPLAYYNGVFYGTTSLGGDNHCNYYGPGIGCGTVFKYVP